MGLCLIIAYLVQFLTEAFMALVSLILFFASAEYHCNSALEGTLEDVSSNLFCTSQASQQSKLGQLTPASSEHLSSSAMFGSCALD